MCRFRQDLTFFLAVSHGSKSLFLGVCQHKSWLAVPDWVFPVRLKRVLWVLSFPIGEISRLQGVMLKVCLTIAHRKKTALPIHGYRSN